MEVLHHLRALLHLTAILLGIRGFQVDMPYAPRRLRPVLATAFAAISLLTLGAPHTARAQSPRTDTRWPVRSREHVDLWLHGFAMISSDSSQIPIFAPTYRTALTVAKHSANIFSELDANHESLAKRLHDNPSLLAAQFLPLYFGSWAEMESALDLFVKSDGNPRAAKTEASAELMAFLASTFRSTEDRDFARRFLAGLRSERDLFFHSWWLAETKKRDQLFEVVDSLWQNVQRPALQPFLNHTQLGNGELMLSLSLDAEGRTVNEGKKMNRVAVGFPESREHATDVLFAFAHEAVSSLTTASVDDNTTPAEKRSGAAAKLQSTASVRGGAILVGKISPELAPKYAAFYLRAAGVAPGTDVMATFAKTFPLPAEMLASIERQIAIAFGGI